MFDAAERSIKKMGVDPESVTYDMVMNRLSELKADIAGHESEYASKAKELKEMEKQSALIKDYTRQSVPTRQRTVRKHRDDMER